MTPSWHDPSTLAHLKSAIRHNLRGILQLRDYLDSDDVLQNVLLRLMVTVDKVKPETQADLLGLAARHIRWELLDLYRTHFGPEGPGRKVVPLSGTGAQPSAPPSDPLAAVALAEAVDKLPEDLRQVFDLVFYNELTHDEAAKALGVATKTIQRRWNAARVQLSRLM